MRSGHHHCSGLCLALTMNQHVLSWWCVNVCSNKKSDEVEQMRLKKPTTKNKWRTYDVWTNHTLAEIWDSQSFFLVVLASNKILESSCHHCSGLCLAIRMKKPWLSLWCAVGLANKKTDELELIQLWPRNKTCHPFSLLYLPKQRF